MSVSLGIARTTLALRDLLLGALRNDPGWQLVHSPPRVTTLPHGKPDQGSGERLNVALVSVAANKTAKNAEPGGAPALFLDLGFLITAHVFQPLHSELMMGAALQAIDATPLLDLAAPALPIDTPLEAEIKASSSAAKQLVRLLVEASLPGDFTALRLPALLIRAGPLAIARDNGGNSLLLPQ